MKKIVIQWLGSRFKTVLSILNNVEYFKIAVVILLFKLNVSSWGSTLYVHLDTCKIVKDYYLHFLQKSNNTFIPMSRQKLIKLFRWPILYWIFTTVTGIFKKYTSSVCNRRPFYYFLVEIILVIIIFISSRRFCET